MGSHYQKNHKEYSKWAYWFSAGGLGEELARLVCWEMPDEWYASTRPDWLRQTHELAIELPEHTAIYAQYLWDGKIGAWFRDQYLLGTHQPIAWRVEQYHVSEYDVVEPAPLSVYADDLGEALALAREAEGNRLLHEQELAIVLEARAQEQLRRVELPPPTAWEQLREALQKVVREVVEEEVE